MGTLQAELTLSTLSFHLVATHIMAICEVTVQVCPSNLCQAGNLFDPCLWHASRAHSWAFPRRLSAWSSRRAALPSCDAESARPTSLG